MQQRKNERNHLGLPIGYAVDNWQPPPRPTDDPLIGQFGRLEKLSVATHSAALFDANQQDAEQRIWVYLAYGPFATLADYRHWMTSACSGPDPHFYAVVDRASGRALGVISYLRIDPESGSIEIGHINYAPAMQRSPLATEALFLLMQNAFALGYRRVEWKCHALNQRSCTAALRFGFRYEGIFRQATVNKGRNRDTAWYALLDNEWPAIERAFVAWLAADNFDAAGKQQQSLAALTRSAVAQ